MGEGSYSQKNNGKNDDVIQSTLHIEVIQKIYYKTEGFGVKLRPPNRHQFLDNKYGHLLWGIIASVYASLVKMKVTISI